MSFFRTYRANFIALFLYAVFTAVLSYPLILKIHTMIAGTGGDVYQILAGINNEWERLVDLGLFASLGDFFNRLRLDPTAINTYLHPIFGQPLGYNLTWLFSFIASGFGMFLLAKFVLENVELKGRAIKERLFLSSRSTSIAAFVAGFFYTFNPAHFVWAMGFAGSTHIEWIPLTTLYILKFIKTPSFGKFLIGSIFFLFLVQGELHFAAFYSVFLIPFLAFSLYRNRKVLKNPAFIRWTSVAVVAGIAVMLWQFLPLIRISTSEDNFLNPGLDQTVQYSTDALSIITPFELHSFLGDKFAFIRDSFTGNAAEYSTYLGLTGLLLLLIAFFAFRRSGQKDILFWGLSGIGFFTLALGPFLHVLGTIEPRVPLPYLIIYDNIPFFENIRSVGRFWIIALLGFSVTIGFGMKYLLDFFRKKNVAFSILLPLIILAMLSLEYLLIPLPLSNLEYSPFYDRLKTEEGDFSVIDLPGSTNYIADAKTRYYASVHRKTRITGLSTARKIANRWKFQSTTPVVSEILYTLPWGKKTPTDIINHEYSLIANDIFSYHNIRYVIIQKEFIGEERDYIVASDLLQLQSFIKANLNIEEVYEDEFLYAYKVVEQKVDDLLYLSIGDNWDILRNASERWIADEATIVVYNLSDRPKDIHMTFEGRTDKHRIQQVSLSINDTLKKTYLVNERFQEFDFTIPDVPPGIQILNLKVHDPFNESKASGVLFRNINYDLKVRSAEDFDRFNGTTGNALIISPRNLDLSTLFQGIGQKMIDDRKIITFEDLIVSDLSNATTLHTWLPLFNELFNHDRTNYDNIETYRDIREESYYSENLTNILAEKNIDLIYLDKKLFNEETRKYIGDHLEKYIPGLVKANGKDFVIYRVPEFKKNSSILFRTSHGWDILENKNGKSKRRKTKNQTVLITHQQEEARVQLQFAARTCPKTKRNVEILTDGIPAENILVENEEIQQFKITFPDSLASGAHKIQLNIYDEEFNFMSEDAIETKQCPIWVSDVRIHQVAK